MLFFKNKYYNNQALQFWKSGNDHLMLDITTDSRNDHRMSDITTDLLLLKTENIYNASCMGNIFYVRVFT